MGRVTIALFSIIGSVMLYLCLRVFKKHHITTRVQNAVMFVPTAIVFGIRAIAAGKQLRIGRDMLLLLIPVCIFFSWLANLLSLKSMQLAPNIGYSLMISKSYVVIAALVAVPLLGSVLTRIDIAAISVIILFMSLILIDPKVEGKKVTSRSWIRTALYACVGWAGLALSSAWLIQQGLDPLVINFWIFAIVSVIIVFESLMVQSTILPPPKSWLPALGVVLSMVLFNRSLQAGYASAPNPGYINAANASSIALLTLVSSYVFDDELSGRKLIGICGVVIGISILFIV